MGKSIFGQSFDPFVSKQLDIRSRIYSGTEDDFISKGNLPKDHLAYSLANNAFLRMSSAVNIETLEKAKFFGDVNYMNSGLAKSFILQGGTLDANQQQRSGLQAYQVGSGEDFGLRPMPGITSMRISSKGRWGTLREASIEIKCFNRDQLSIVEALYLRPGYTVLIEWGNTLFYNNKFDLVNNIKFIDFFAENKSLNEFHQEIINKREQYSGNYDAFIGPVTNFNIKHNPDGSYNCISKVVTWGSIIESLKINTSSDTKEIEQVMVGPEPEFTQINKTLNTSTNPEALNSSFLETLLKAIYKTCNKPKYNTGKIFTIVIKNMYNKYMDTNIYGNSISKNLTLAQVDTPLYSFITIPFTTSNSNNNGPTITNTNLNVYMSLGSLLSILSKNCLIYNRNNEPIININFNTDENLCYSPDYQISINPKICLIKYEGPELESLGINKLDKTYNRVLPTFKKSNSHVGYMMNIMLNMEFVWDLLNTSQFENKDINLYDFLKRIMDGINRSLGGVNEFNIGYYEDTNTLIITDNQILDTEVDKTLTVIKTTGLKSNVRDITIDSKLSNQLSSLIAIGAQASDNVATGIDSSVFQQYNKGLKDRFFTIKKDVTNNSLTEEEYKQALTKDERAVKIKELITNLYSNRKIIPDNIETYKTYYDEILKSLKVKSNSSTGIIPFTYNIKMNGISGISIGQLFSIEPNRLPKNYLNPNNPNQPLVAFLVTSIDETIENNSWVKSIGGQVSPIRDLKIKS